MDVVVFKAVLIEKCFLKFHILHHKTVLSDNKSVQLADSLSIHPLAQTPVAVLDGSYTYLFFWAGLINTV